MRFSMHLGKWVTWHKSPYNTFDYVSFIFFLSLNLSLSIHKKWAKTRKLLLLSISALHRWNSQFFHLSFCELLNLLQRVGKGNVHQFIIQKIYPIFLIWELEPDIIMIISRSPLFFLQVILRISIDR